MKCDFNLTFESIDKDLNWLNLSRITYRFLEWHYITGINL